MSYKVLYFTRTGTSKRVAKKIADGLDCEIIEITDNMVWKGMIGFLKGGYYSSADKDVDIQVSQPVNVEDEPIVVSPLWAGKVAPAIKKFLKSTRLDTVHLVVTSSGGILKNRLAYKSVSDVVKNMHNEDVVIESLVNRLSAKG